MYYVKYIVYDIVMKVIGYVRVSSINSKIKGNSIKSQIKKIKDYCRLNDLELVDIYSDEGKSGRSIKNRFGYIDMINWIKNNSVNGIVVYSISRIGRRLKDVVDLLDMLKENDIKFYSIKENISNDNKVSELIMNILSSISEFECLMIGDRVKEIKRYKKENGEVYGRLVYGYDNVNGKMIVNEFERNIVKRIKNLRSRGWSYWKISDKLNDEGISSKEGKIWYGSSIYNMLKFYE